MSPTTVQRVAAPITSPWTSATFAALFGALAAATVAPIWLVEWLPMTDLGGHIELMDVAARYEDPGTLYSEIYRLPRGFEPNTVATYLARLLGPLVGVAVVVKLQLSLYAVGLPLSMLAMCAAFGRPIWLSLLSFLLVYNAIAAYGFLNFLLAIPLLFFSVAVARRLGERGGLGWALLLALCLQLTYFAHVIAFLVALAMTGAVLFCFVPSLRTAWRAFVPALSMGPFVIWFHTKFVALEATHGGRRFKPAAKGFGAKRADLELLVEQINDYGLNYFSAHMDELVFILLALVWLVLMAQARAPSAPVRAFRRGLREPFRRYALECLTLCVIVGYFALPSHIEQVAVITERNVILFLLLLTLWPRVSFSATGPRLAMLVAVCAGLAYPVWVAARFLEFEQKEARPLASALEKLKPKTRLSYVITHSDGPVANFSALRHLPKAMHALYNGGVTDDSFALRPSTPIQYKEGKEPTRPYARFWLRQAAYRKNDYVVYRSKTPAPQSSIKGFARLLSHHGSWYVYEILPDTSHGPRLVSSPGKGGAPVEHDCPKGAALTSLATRETDVMKSVSPVCKAPQVKEDHSIIWSRIGQSPVLGGKGVGGRARNLRCKASGVVVGLHGTRGRYVSSVGLWCAQVEVSGTRLKLGAPYKIDPVGPVAKTPFDLLCPTNQVAGGFHGRGGVVLDSVGLCCAPLARVLTAAVPVPKPKVAPPVSPAPGKAGPAARRKGTKGKRIGPAKIPRKGVHKVAPKPPVKILEPAPPAPLEVTPPAPAEKQPPAPAKPVPPPPAKVSPAEGEPPKDVEPALDFKLLKQLLPGARELFKGGGRKGEGEKKAKERER